MFSAGKLIFGRPRFRTVANLSGFSISHDASGWEVDGMRGRIYAASDFSGTILWKPLDSAVFVYPPAEPDSFLERRSDPSQEYPNALQLPSRNGCAGWVAKFALDPSRNRIFWVDYFGGFLGRMEISENGSMVGWGVVNDPNGGVCNNNAIGSIVVDQSSGRVAASWRALGDDKGDKLRIVHVDPQNYDAVVSEAYRSGDPPTFPGTGRWAPTPGLMCFANYPSSPAAAVVSSNPDSGKFADNSVYFRSEFWQSSWQSPGNAYRFVDEYATQPGWSGVLWSRPCGLGLSHNHYGSFKVFRMEGPSGFGLNATARLDWSSVPGYLTSGEPSLADDKSYDDYWALHPNLPIAYLLRRRGLGFMGVAESTRLATWDISGLTASLYSADFQGGVVDLSPSLVKYIGSMDLPFDARNPRVDHHNGRMYCERVVTYQRPAPTFDPPQVRYVIEVDLGR